MLDASTADGDARVERAIGWATQFLGPCETRILTQTPWGATVQLSHESGRAYLKVLGAGQSSAIDAWQSAAQWASNHVPEVIASEAVCGHLLIADHGATGAIGSRDPGIAGLIDCITTLQSATARDAWHVAGAQPLSAAGLLERMDKFFSLSATEDASLAAYFGADRALGYRAILEAGRDSLNSALGMAFALAPCFNHGDLHRRNAAVDDAGHVWVHDWDTSYWGPAPVAFAGMLTSANDVARCIDGYGWFSDKDARDPGTVIMEVALKSLVAKGYADEATLRRAFVPGLLAGMLAQLTEYRHFRPKTDEDLQICVPHIEQLLEGLVQLLAVFAAQSEAQTRGLADALIHAREMDAATFLLHRAVDIEELDPALLVPDDLRTAAEARRILAINAALSAADHPATCPTLPSGPEFIGDEEKLSEISRLGRDLFMQNGCLVLENAIPRETIDACRSALIKDGTGAEGRPLDVGNKRAMSAVAVGGAFNDPALYAARPLIGVLQQLLGKDMVIGSFTVVTSGPGAAQQHLHIDHSELYPELAQQPDTPPFAVTVLIPLVDIDEDLGGTRVLKGSHRVERKRGQSMPYQSVRPDRGSALMFDYRLFHAGEPNRSDRERPVLSIVFQRAWFRDASNFANQAPLQISAAEHARILPAHTSLFDQATQIEDPNS